MVQSQTLPFKIQILLVFPTSTGIDTRFMTEEQPAATQSKNPLDLTHLDVDILSRHVTDTGKILPRRITGLTAHQQRHVTRQIKRARNLLLMQ